MYVCMLNCIYVCVCICSKTGSFCSTFIAISGLGTNRCGGSYIVILNIFISYMCLAKYGASEAIYLCNVVEKIHQYFRPKMRQMF